MGIGTESPYAPLQVGAGIPLYSTGQLDVWQASKPVTSIGNVNIYSNDSATINTGGSIGFGGANGSNTYVFGKVAGRLENASGYAGYLQFSTTLASSEISEKMRITSAGNVGIGTTSPYARLSITSAGITSSTLAFAVDNASSTQLMRIDDAGNISMGGDGFYYDASTTVSHLNAEFGSMSFDEDAGIVSWINLPFVSTTIPQGTIMSYSAQINNTDILTIYGETNGSGGLQNPRVGVGTTTPNAKLTIYSDTIATSSNALTVYNTSSTRLLKVADSGDISFGNADGLYYEASSSVTYVNSLQTGPQSFDEDAGIVSWINLPITTTTAGIVNSYSAQIASNDILTIYGETDGSGGILNTKVGINSNTPMATLAVQGYASSLPIFDVASSSGASFLRVLANGKVGIGTTTPRNPLDVRAVGGTEEVLRIGGGSTNDTYGFGVGGGSHAAGGYFGLWHFSATTNDWDTNVFLVTPTGDFYPQHNIQIAPPSGYTNGNNLGLFPQTDATLENAVLKLYGANALQFDVRPYTGTWGTQVTAMYINGVGNVGIATTTPLARLTIAGATIATSSNALTVYNASTTRLFKVADSGDISMGSADGFYYEASTSISYVNSLQTGGLNFDDNAGLVSWVDMTIDNNATTGTPEGYTASLNGNPMILVYGDSVGDGTVTNMTVSIGTSTTSTYKLYIDAGGSANAGLGVNGYIKSSGFIAGTTTLDLAETYPLDPNCSALGNCPAVGDVVCANEKNVNIQIPDPSNPSSTIDTVNTLFVIEKCSATSTDNAIGVVSANPGFVLGGYDLNDTLKSKNPGLYPSTYQPVALSGRVPVNVSLENGPIKAGDLLTSSVQPGVAVKAVEPGRVIGVALESASATSSVPTIKMFVNPHWSVGSLTEEQISNELPDFSVQGILDSFTVAVENSLRKLGMLLKNGVATVKQLFADKVQTNQLCVGATCVNEQQLQDLLNKTNTQPAAPVIETPTTTEPPASTTTPVVETPTTTPPVTEPVAPVVETPPTTEPAPPTEVTPPPTEVTPPPAEPAPVVVEPAPAPEPAPTPAPAPADTGTVTP